MRRRRDENGGSSRRSTTTRRGECPRSRKRPPVRPSISTTHHSQALRIAMRMSRRDEPSEDGQTTATCCGPVLADMNALRPRQADLRNRVAISLHAVDYKCEVLAFHVNARHKKSKKAGANPRQKASCCRNTFEWCFVAFTSLGEFQQFQETKRLGNDARPKARTRCASLATRHFVADHPEKCRNDVVIEPGAQVA